MTEPQPSIQQHAAFGKAIGLIICAMALPWMTSVSPETYPAER